MTLLIDIKIDILTPLLATTMSTMLYDIPHQLHTADDLRFESYCMDFRLFFEEDLRRKTSSLETPTF